MLKGQDYNVENLANINSFTNFIAFVVTLRDKLLFEMDIVNTQVGFAFEGKKVRKRRVVYAYNTKWIYGQDVPPGYETGFLQYDFQNKKYAYEISYMTVLVEYNPNEEDVFKQDSDVRNKEVRRLFAYVMENFAYKYNEVVSGKNFLDPIFCITTAFFYGVYYRNKGTGLYEHIVLTLMASAREKKEIPTKIWDVNETFNNTYVMWRFYINKAKYCFSINMNIESVLYAAIAIEAYLMQIIKDNGRYDEYKVYAQEGKNLGFTSAKNFIRKNELLDKEDLRLIDKSYSKLRKYRAQIVHGDLEKPYLEKEITENVINILEDVFCKIEDSYVEQKSQNISGLDWNIEYDKMEGAQKTCDERRYDDAIKYYSENILKNIYVDASLYNRACCYSELGLSGKAIEDLQVCISKKYKLNEVYNLLGIEYCKIQLYSQAKEAFSLAINLTPDRVVLYHNKAVAEAYLKEYENAIKDYTIAIEMDSCNSIYLLDRAKTYFQMNLLKQAEQDIVLTISIDKSKTGDFDLKSLCLDILNAYVKQNKRSYAIKFCNECSSWFEEDIKFVKQMKKCIKVR